jgi:uncharacterized protein YlxW (UPF0749 family)
MKKLILAILVCWVMACTLFLIVSFKPVNSQEINTSEQRLQSQIDDLSQKISAFNNAVSQLQSQINDAGTVTGSSSNEEILTKIDAITTEGMNLTTKINALQTHVTDLQDKLKASGTIIGAVPIIVNGLSIVFITNDIQIGRTESISPNVAQFALKIINTTSLSLTNVDLTGTISCSRGFSQPLASGYPQLTDGSGLCTYVYYLQNGMLYFEAFGNAKTSLTIPAGGSITLRPKISILAAENDNLQEMVFKIALQSLTYDRVAAK